MKFELRPYNYGLSDDELLGDLRAVAQRLGRNSLTKDEYDQNGRLCSAAFRKRFGSWGKALDLAGLKRSSYHKIGPEEYLADVRRVATNLQSASLTREDYEKLGTFSYGAVVRHLGPWKAVLDKAGLKRAANFNPPVSDEDLFENLEQLWEKLGHQPSRNDFVKPVSRYSYSPYPRRFGSYRKALEAFVASFETEATEEPGVPADAESSGIATATFSKPIHKTSRNVSWRIRFLVMRRDDFKCQLCGVSPAARPGTVLVVDHIKPWASGGETVMENLQTLCEPCNGGKSNLPMHPDGEG